MLKIWGRRDSPNVQKVLWGCEEVGFNYDRVDLGGKFGGGDTPEYRAKNPNGTVPTLEDDGFVLWESHAILRYVAGLADAEALYPRVLRQRALVDQWLDWQAVHQAQAIRGLVMLVLRPGAAPPTPEQLDVAGKAAEAAFALLDRHLTQTPYVAGEAFTLADIPLGVGTHRWLNLPIERRSFPAVSEWYGRISARPAFARAMSPS